MAGLQAIVETLDTIDEGLRSHYSEANGKYVLNVEDLENHPRAQGLKRTVDSLRRERDEAIQHLQPFRERNITPEKVDELLSLSEKKELLEELEKAGGIDALIAQRLQEQTTGYEREKKSLEEKMHEAESRADRAERQRRTDLLEREIRRACKAVEVDPNSEDDVVNYIMYSPKKDKDTPHYDIAEDDSVICYRPLPVDAPKGAQPEIWYGKDGATPKPIADFLEDCRLANKHITWWPRSYGAGVTPGAGKLPNGVTNVSELTARQKMELGRQQAEQRRG